MRSSLHLAVCRVAVWVMCAATEIESQPSLRVRESERERQKSCHRVELYTGAESGWTRSSGIVFTDASRYECRYSDSRGLNPGARKTHLPHTHTQPSNNLHPMLACFRWGIFFFLPYFRLFPIFLRSISQTHTHTHIFRRHGWIDLPGKNFRATIHHFQSE